MSIQERDRRWRLEQQRRHQERRIIEAETRQAKRNAYEKHKRNAAKANLKRMAWDWH